MKKTLPMSEPIMGCYPYHAHIQTAIGAYTKSHIPWVYNYSIQLFVPINFNEGCRVDYVIPEPYGLLPGVRRTIIDRKVALDVYNGILVFLKSNINHGY